MYEVLIYYNEEEIIVKKKMIIALGTAACIMLAGCGESKVDSASNSTVNGESGKTEVSSVTEVETSSAEAVYNIGDTALLNDWEISVTDLQIVESIQGDYGSFSPKEEGNKYAHVYATVTNKGKEADNFCPTYGFGDDVKAKILYGDGYEFTATNLLGYSNELHDQTINPLSSKTGELAFEIPEAVAGSTDELFIQFSSGNDSIKFKIR